MQRGELAGLLTSDNVGEFLMIQAALGKTPGLPAAVRTELSGLKE
jgi:hypothetical protein